MKGRTVLAAALLSVLLAFPATARGLDVAETLAQAGWSEESLSLFTEKPERAVVLPPGGGVEGTFRLEPGKGVAWRTRVSAGPARGAILLHSEGMNATSRDYHPPRMHFPVSVTVVFGKDRQDIPLRSRVFSFIGGLLHGFPPRGIRLTYAWGHDAPVGSMYRPEEERTVFILAGEDERGKNVESVRTFADDFRAAYGRDPSGPVTQVIVESDRPPKEKETIRAGAGIRFRVP